MYANESVARASTGSKVQDEAALAGEACKSLLVSIGELRGRLTPVLDDSPRPTAGREVSEKQAVPPTLDGTFRALRDEIDSAISAVNDTISRLLI